MFWYQFGSPAEPLWSEKLQGLNQNLDQIPQPNWSDGKLFGVWTVDLVPGGTSGPGGPAHTPCTSDTSCRSSHLQNNRQPGERSRATPEVQRDQWTVRTSLDECEAGVVIGTVSLLGAAAGVVLTAVAADGGP